MKSNESLEKTSEPCSIEKKQDNFKNQLRFLTQVKCFAILSIVNSFIIE